jgi:hypothetical protein
VRSSAGLKRSSSQRSPSERTRRAAAFLGHAPGLWLVCREPLPRALWVPNAVAVLGTLVATAAAWWTARPPVRLAAALAAWAAGHVLWGAFLAVRLPRRTAGTPGPDQRGTAGPAE